MYKYLTTLKTLALTILAFVAGATLFTDNLSKIYEVTSKTFFPEEKPPEISLRDPSPLYLGRSRSIDGTISSTIAVIAEFIVTKKTILPINNCEIRFYLGDKPARDENTILDLPTGVFDRKISGFFIFEKINYSKDLKVRVECANAVTSWLVLPVPKLPTR